MADVPYHSLCYLEARREVRVDALREQLRTIERTLEDQGRQLADTVDQLQLALERVRQALGKGGV